MVCCTCPRGCSDCAECCVGATIYISKLGGSWNCVSSLIQILSLGPLQIKILLLLISYMWLPQAPLMPPFFPPLPQLHPTRKMLMTMTVSLNLIIHLYQILFYTIVRANQPLNVTLNKSHEQLNIMYYNVRSLLPKTDEPRAVC